MGKGSAPRPTNKKVYGENYDRIFRQVDAQEASLIEEAQILQDLQEAHEKEKEMGQGIQQRIQIKRNEWGAKCTL